MNSRKHSSMLSHRQIRRRVAREKALFQKEVQNILAKQRKAHEVDSTKEKKVDESSVSAAYKSETQMETNSQDFLHSQDEENIDYRYLLKFLCTADSDEDCDKILRDFEHRSPEETVIQEDIVNDLLNHEDQKDFEKFDFFDIMKSIFNDDTEVENFDCDDDDDKYLEELMSLDKEDPKYIFVDKMRSQCIKFIHTIPHVYINGLLDLLRSEGYPFPKDARTFLKTPRVSVTREMGDGEYCHYGIASAITTFLTSYKKNIVDTDCVKLIVNIDGALLANSSEDGSWIISVSEIILNQVEVVGIYNGKQKPKDSDDLVQEFVQELIELIKNGIKFEGRTYKVLLHCLVCDAPAKAYILKTKLYSGYYSCSKCTIKGDYQNKVYFPTREQKIAVLRTDENFRNQQYEKNKAVFDEFQTGESIMKKIVNFRPITDVVLDYMHLVCLGVMLKLIELWIQNSKVALSEYQRQQITERLLNFKKSMTADFSRNPRQFNNVRRTWKAHELRSFLLYTGPVALHKILPDNMYLNFLCLHVAITILVNPILCQDEEYLTYAEQLLISFVEGYEKCYGEIHMVFNVHNLVHLVDDVKRFGPLDNFSAFRFENHIRKVKQFIRKGDKRLQQLANRLMEIRRANAYCSTIEKIEKMDFRLQPVMKPFQFVQENSFKIDCRNEKDKYVLLDDGKFLECHYFIKKDNEQVWVEGHLFDIVENFYEQPLPSSLLNINIIKPSSAKKATQMFPYENIYAKVCKFPYYRTDMESSDNESMENESSENEFVAIPLIHTYKQK